MAQLSSAGDPKRRAESSGIGRQSPDAPASAVTSPTFYDTSSPTGDPTVAAQETAASAPHTYTGARASPASGKHAAGREYAQALSKASQPRRRMPQWYERWFELPPTFEASLRRQSAVRSSFLHHMLNEESFQRFLNTLLCYLFLNIDVLSPNCADRVDMCVNACLLI